MTITDHYAPVMAESETISRAEAARRLSVSLQTLDGYAREGLLTRLKNPVTKRVRFAVDEVEALRRQREEGQ